MLIYLLMAIVLAVRPEGLFPASRDERSAVNRAQRRRVRCVVVGRCCCWRSYRAASRGNSLRVRCSRAS